MRRSLALSWAKCGSRRQLSGIFPVQCEYMPELYQERALRASDLLKTRALVAVCDVDKGALHSCGSMAEEFSAQSDSI